MTRGPLAAIAVVATLALPSTLEGQMTLASVELTLGQSRSAVLERLREATRVDSLPGRADDWTVFDRAVPPVRPIGGVTFRNGRLVGIRRDWSPDVRGSDVEAMRAAVGALTTLYSDGRPRCAIIDRASHSPGFDGSGIDLRCGDRRVSILVFRIVVDGKAQEGYTVTEFLDAPGNVAPR